MTDVSELANGVAEADPLLLREPREILELAMRDTEHVVPAERALLGVVAFPVEVGVVHGAGVDRREVQADVGILRERSQMREALGRRRRGSVGRVEQHLGVGPPNPAHDVTVELGAGMQQLAGPLVAGVEMENRGSGLRCRQRILDELARRDRHVRVLLLRHLLVQGAFDDQGLHRLA